MIFISVQQISIYFTWQLDILIQNLHSLNVERDLVHVLFSYKTEEEKSMIGEFERKTRQFARVFGYSDTRERNAYTPSIRPHILSKHLLKYPALEHEVLFYHDSDLLFRELPDLQVLVAGNMWYAADTRSYTGYNYLSGILSTPELQHLTSIVGVTEELIKENDSNSGGAQWIIKNVTSFFWSKVERDCESMYEFLESINVSRKYLNAGNKLPEIQSWCSDMWCLLWNGWLEGRDIRLTDELDFCWPTDPISEWFRKKILHYAGNVEDKRYFRKAEYADFPPYYDHNLNKIDPASSSFPLFESIRKYREKFLSSARAELPDVTFILMPHPETSFNGDNLERYIAWLQKTFSNEILILEIGANRTSVPSITTDKLSYSFFNAEEVGKTGSQLTFLRTVLCDRKVVKTNHAILIKDAYIISPQTLDSYLPSLGKSSWLFPDITVIEADSIFSALFSKVLDYEILDFNLSKFPDPIKTTGKSFFLFNASKSEETPIEQKRIEDSKQYVYSLRFLN